MARAPSKKQIEFADAIAEALNLDFPTSSCEYTAQEYFFFIRDHVDAFMQLQNEISLPCDLNDNYEHDAWTEHF